MASSVPPRRQSGAPRRPSARQAANRRRRNRTLAGASTLAVLVAVAVIVSLAALGGGSGSATASFATGPASAQVVNAVTTMPLTQQVGASQVTKTIPPTAISGAALTAAGKPEVLYIGAEYCPYCAAERWALAAALSHFGTWTGLEVTHSSSTDGFPDTPTLSFATATFTSPYLYFRSVEETTNQACTTGSPDCAPNGYKLLQPPTASEQKLEGTYDPGSSIPFIDLGGKAVVIGASYSPQTLAGQTPAEVATRLGEPSTADAEEIGSAAAGITESLCRMTGGSPAGVCAAVSG